MNQPVYEALAQERELCFKRALLIDQLLAEYSPPEPKKAEEPSPNCGLTSKPVIAVSPPPPPPVPATENSQAKIDFKGTIIKPEVKRYSRVILKDASWKNCPHDLWNNANFINNLFDVKIQTSSQMEKAVFARLIYFRHSTKTTKHHPTTIAKAIDKSRTGYNVSMDKYDKWLQEKPRFLGMVEKFLAEYTQSRKNGGLMT